MAGVMRSYNQEQNIIYVIISLKTNWRKLLLEISLVTDPTHDR